MSGTPASSGLPPLQGFRIPAEWEPHEATWLAWPHHRADWPRKFAPIPWVFGEIVRKTAASEKVRILVSSARHEKEARLLLSRIGVGEPGATANSVQFFRIPTNRAWARDFGPIHVRRQEPPSELAVAGFRFNAWARYPDYDRDCPGGGKDRRRNEAPVPPRALQREGRRAGGRKHRRERKRKPADDRGMPPGPGGAGPKSPPGAGGHRGCSEELPWSFPYSLAWTRDCGR